MLSSEQANALLDKLGYAGIRWYPGKSDCELGYTIDEDIDWCLEGLTRIPDHYLATMRGRLEEAIMDPTAHREAMRRDVLNLVRA